MTRGRPGTFVLVALALAAGGVTGAQAPVRDASASVPRLPGTASINGVVLSDESPSRPLRRATVSLVSGDLRVPLSTVTDDAGRFAFEGVPAGNYGVSASKPAYVGAFYGSKQPGRGPGVPIAMRDGQRVTGVTLKMIRGGVIAGTLRLPGREPAQGMPIVVVGVESAAGGGRRLRLDGGRATTDDRGEFRVYGLAPGDYVVQAQPSGLLSGAPSNAADAPLTIASDVSWAQQVAQLRAGAPGSAAPATPQPPQRGHTINYATVYFPGTADPSAAGTVSVGAGEERSGIDFNMVFAETAKLSGGVLGPDGAPLPNAQVTIAPRDDGLNLAGLAAPRAAVKSKPDGSFVVPAVQPGHYRLWARADTTSPPGTAAASLWALQDLDIDGHDVSGVSLEMQPGMTVSGRVAFESSARQAPAPADLARGHVTLTPMDADGASAPPVTAAGATTAVAADGTFAVAGLPPGSYRVGIEFPGIRVGVAAREDGWTLRSILAGGVDVSDRALEIAPRQDASGLVATFTDRPTELAGTLVDQATRPASGYPIVVFSTDRRDWIAGSRRVIEIRPATDGSFHAAGLPAGKYYVCAVVDLEPGALDDPSFLDQLAPASLTVTLAEGVKTVQNLRLAGAR